MRNPKRGGQVILMWRAHGFKALLQESSNALPYPYWALTSSGVPHKGWACLSFGPMDTDPLGPLVYARQALSSVFILFSTYLNRLLVSAHNFICTLKIL